MSWVRQVTYGGIRTFAMKFALGFFISDFRVSVRIAEILK